MKRRGVVRQIGRGVWAVVWAILVIGYYAVMGVLIGLTLVAGRGRA